MASLKQSKQRGARLISLVLAFLLLLLLSEARQARAEFEAGLKAYESGDYAQAFKEWLPLAKKNHAAAQHNIGVMYFEGQGVRQSYAEARKWYERAAANGSADAQFNLGVMFDQAQGVPQDFAKAVHWYRQAAISGHAQAQHNLAILYTLGQGAPQDFFLAYFWAMLAASSFDVSLEQHAASVQVRDKLEEYLTPAEIDRARELAGRWRPGGGEPG